MTQQASSSPRRFIRRSVELHIQLLFPDRNITIPPKALLTDLSQKGAKIHSPVPLEPGQTLRIVPNEGFRFAIPGRVVWSRQSQAGEGHEGGLEFLTAGA
jgi:hypothetical protein